MTSYRLRGPAEQADEELRKHLEDAEASRGCPYLESEKADLRKNFLATSWKQHRLEYERYTAAFNELVSYFKLWAHGGDRAVAIDIRTGQTYAIPALYLKYKNCERLYLDRGVDPSRWVIVSPVKMWLSCKDRQDFVQGGLHATEISGSARRHAGGGSR